MQMSPGTTVTQQDLNPKPDLIPAHQHNLGNLPATSMDISDTTFQFGYNEQSMDFDSVGLASFEDFIGGVVEWETPQSGIIPASDASELSAISTAVSSLIQDTSDQKLATWRAAKPLAPLTQATPASKHAANLIARTVAAFPQMMTRRHTFPPFIHPHWHESSVPEILASCMSIAQLFVARTPDTRGFLWRAIEAEEQRLLDEVCFCIVCYPCFFDTDCYFRFWVRAARAFTNRG